MSRFQHFAYLRARKLFAVRAAWLCLVLAAGLPALTPPAARAQAAVSPRERASFNAGWRFQKGDPAGAEGRLAYERIKPWLVAAGKEFVVNTGTATPNRPEGNLGEDVSYTRRDFDDRGWRQLNLPHDWGVEGPFSQELPGETGKLPWAGVGWYRKRFNVPASDKGRQLHLDIDGAMSYASVWLNGKFVGGWPYGYAFVSARPHALHRPRRGECHLHSTRQSARILALVSGRGTVSQRLAREDRARPRRTLGRLRDHARSHARCGDHRTQDHD